MSKYKLHLLYQVVSTLIIEAETAQEAEQKWYDGKYYDSDINVLEENVGGIPWQLKGVEEV